MIHKAARELNYHKFTINLHNMINTLKLYDKKEMLWSFHLLMASFSLLFVFADLMSFLKQIRNETARTVSCNNNIERDSSLELRKELDGVSDNTLINDVWWWLASWQVYPTFWVVSPDHGRPPQPGCTSNSKSWHWPDFFLPFLSNVFG